METCNKVITTSKVAAGKRTYYFDHLATKNGSSYVKIKEHVVLGEGKTETHRIMIFEENLQAVIDVLVAMLPQNQETAAQAA